MQPIKISCQQVWKVFGATPAHIASSVTPAMTRSEVLEQTGHVLAVRDVSFEVKEGEIFVVMGLSGSGKSTLIRCLSRLIDPTRGQIIVNGADVTGLDAAGLRELRRHTMSMVFQRFGLFSHRRVIDNVAYGLEVQRRPKQERRERAMEVLEKVGLAAWANHYPQQLSGGMQQRVGLARALALDPGILLFDEPFSALDPLIRREMQDELIRLQQEEQRTIVFITHDFAEAIRLGDRVAIMKDGQLDQIGTPEELVVNPATDYVREFVTDVPRERVLRAGSVMTAPALGASVAVARSARISEVLAALVSSDAPVAVVDEDDRVIGSIDRARVATLLGESRRDVRS